MVRSSARVLSSLSLAAALAGLQGCIGDDDGGGNKGVRVKTKLMRAETATAAPKRTAMATGAASPAWSSDMTISSLRVPVKQISLHNAAFDHAVELFLCTGPTAGCQVELAGTAFQDALDASPRQVEMGWYDFIFVKTCEDGENTYPVSVTGTVSLEGVTRYTKTSGILGETGPAEPVTITPSGCGRTYALPRPLVISDSLGEQVDFTLYFDMQHIAYAALGTFATADGWNGNCTGARPPEAGAPSVPYLCLAYPDVSGIIDSRPAVLERYRIGNGGIVGLFFTSGSDLPVGGYTRGYYQEGVANAWHHKFNMPIRDLRKNPDGTLYVAEFGGGPTGAVGSAFKVTSFPRSSHSGTYTSTNESTGADVSGSYDAVRLP